MQITVQVGIDPASYVNEQYQRRVRAPSVRPDCGRAQAPEAHVTMAMGYSLVRLGDPDRGRAFLLPALSGDGQLPAAVLLALSAGAQPDY
jgi:hypothetical protein